MSDFLLVWEANGHRHTHHLEEDEPVLIGRHDSCAVQLPFNTVSRRHGLLVAREGAVYLHNMSRTNPILTDEGQSLAHDETCTLEEQQRFKIGPVTFHLLSLPAQLSELKIRCANCRRVVEYEPESFCPWCGTALAAGQTVAE